MKKSEAIKKLNELLVGWESSRLTDGKCAKSILKLLEDEIGMLPPAYSDKSIWDRSENSYAQFNEWEPEDEKK